MSLKSKHFTVLVSISCKLLSDSCLQHHMWRRYM